MLIKIGNKQYDERELETLAKAGVLDIVQKHDPASTTLDATPLHGPWPGSTTQFGPFSQPGVRPERLSTLVRARSLAQLLTPRPSDLNTEILQVMTGQTAGAGSNATTFCGDPPTPGQLKVCAQTYGWGKFYMKTRLNAVPEIGQRRNRADVAGTILNAGPSDFPFMPSILKDPNFDTRSHLGEALFPFGNECE